MRPSSEPGNVHGRAAHLGRFSERGGRGPAACVAATGAQTALAVVMDDPPRQPYPAQPGRAEGRRASGVVRLQHLDPDRAVSGDRPPAGPDRGQAACRAGISCDQLPARPADAGEAGRVAAVRRHATLSEPGEGRRRGRFFHWLGWAWRGDDHVRRADAGLRAPARSRPRRPAARPPYRHRGRRRTR